MREIMCTDDGCTLDPPKTYQVGGGAPSENVSYLSPGTNGLNPEAGSWLIPLSTAKRSTSRKTGSRRRRRQVGGGIKRQTGGRRKRGRKSKVKRLQTGGRKRVQTGGRKRLQTGGRKRRGTKRRRRCVK